MDSDEWALTWQNSRASIDRKLHLLDHFFNPLLDAFFHFLLIHAKPSVTSAFGLADPATEVLPTVDADLRRRAAKLVKKVFIPMFDSNPDHWYLLVIDMVRNELVYLDSMPSKERRMMRERQIRKASIFVEEMLDDKAFYWRADFRIPNVSAFPIVSPSNLPKQTNGVDCGVYVCRWMALAERWRKYDLGDVNDFARVRLLVDLIRKPYNGKNEVITEGAIAFFAEPGWRSLQNLP